MDIPIAGQQLAIDSAEYSLAIRTSAGYEIRAEGDAQLETSDGNAVTLSFEGESAPPIDLEYFFRGTVSAASASRSGTLSIAMDTGNTLLVPADENFEAWTVTGPGGYRIVSMPDGELAVWTPREK